jgi:hypothetical protein
MTLTISYCVNCNRSFVERYSTSSNGYQCKKCEADFPEFTLGNLIKYPQNSFLFNRTNYHKMLWKSPWYEDIHKALKDAKELPEYSKEELEAMI